MPWKSVKQRQWGHTYEGMKALGGKKAVEEWNKETGDRKLPKRVKKGK